MVWLKGRHNIQDDVWFIDSKRIQRNHVPKDTALGTPKRPWKQQYRLSRPHLCWVLPSNVCGELPVAGSGPVEVQCRMAGYLRNEWKVARG